MNNIKVSVIMTFYNEEKYLSKAIDSILAQTYSAWELIIVNDGSTDKSPEIVKNYTDSRIKYYSYTPNKKKAYANNVGLENAQGEYILFFDADDIACPNMIASQVEYLDSHPECIRVGGAFSIIDENGEITQEKTGDQYKTDIEIRTYELFGNCLTSGGSMYRHEIVKRYGLKYDTKAVVSQDYLFWINMLPLGEFAYIDEVVYLYRIGHQSHTQRIVNANKEWYDNFMRQIFMHAWTQRGYKLDEEDIRFIHDFLYKKALVWKIHDFQQGIKTFIKVKKQSNELKLQEKDLIVRYYKKLWKDIYLRYYYDLIRRAKAVLFKR